MKIIKNILRIIIILYLAIILLINISATISTKFQKKGLPSVLGYTYYVADDNDRISRIKPGDVVIIKKQKEYKVDDAITFNNRGAYITNIVKEIDLENASLMTVDDMKKILLGPVNHDDVVGKVVYVFSGGGRYVRMVQDTTVIILSFVFGFAILVGLNALED
jgi:hypothetical protein